MALQSDIVNNHVNNDISININKSKENNNEQEGSKNENPNENNNNNNNSLNNIKSRTANELRSKYENLEKSLTEDDPEAEDHDLTLAQSSKTARNALHKIKKANPIDSETTSSETDTPTETILVRKSSKTHDIDHAPMAFDPNFNQIHYVSPTQNQITTPYVHSHINTPAKPTSNQPSLQSQQQSIPPHYNANMFPKEKPNIKKNISRTQGNNDHDYVITIFNYPFTYTEFAFITGSIIVGCLVLYKAYKQNSSSNWASGKYSAYRRQ